MNVHNQINPTCPIINEWPGVLGEIAECEKENNIALFALAYGGTQIYIAKNKILPIIGQRANRYLQKYYVGCRLNVPLAKKTCAKVLIAQGKSATEIARILHLNERTIWRICKRHKKQRFSKNDNTSNNASSSIPTR